jgi:methylaspartate mutase sigma subunit
MSSTTPAVVVGTIGSDAHVVGVTLIEHALKEAGFEVTNLGAQTAKSEFVAAAEREDADAVLVSSLDGHAEQNCDGLHEQLRAAGLDPTTYVGGNLSVGQSEFAEVEREFRRLGFDRVFRPGTGFEAVVAALRDDLDWSVEETGTESARARTEVRP